MEEPELLTKEQKFNDIMKKRTMKLNVFKKSLTLTQTQLLNI